MVPAGLKLRSKTTRMTPLTEDVPLSRASTGATATVQTNDDKEWKISQNVVGMHINAMIFVRALLIGTNINIDQFANLETKTIRQLGQGQTDDDGNDVSGFVAVSDVGAAVLFADTGSARKFARKVDDETAPSLTYITSGNSKVTTLKVEL